MTIEDDLYFCGRVYNSEHVPTLSDPLYLHYQTEYTSINISTSLEAIIVEQGDKPGGHWTEAGGRITTLQLQIFVSYTTLVLSIAVYQI